MRFVSKVYTNIRTIIAEYGQDLLSEVCWDEEMYCALRVNYGVGFWGAGCTRRMLLLLGLLFIRRAVFHEELSLIGILAFHDLSPDLCLMR